MAPCCRRVGGSDGNTELSHVSIGSPEALQPRRINSSAVGIRPVETSVRVRTSGAVGSSSTARRRYPAFSWYPVLIEGHLRRRLLHIAAENGMEGTVVRRLASPYRPGRSSALIKYTVRRSTDVIIVGWWPRHIVFICPVSASQPVR